MQSTIHSNTPRGLACSLPRRKALYCKPKRLICRQQGNQPQTQDAVVVQPVLMPMPPVPQDGTTAAYAPPPGYPAGYPPMPARPDQQYYAAPPGYYPPLPPPQQAKEESVFSSVPWFIWMGAGLVGGTVLNKVTEFMRNPKTPQQMMMEMAMKQMSGAMGAKPPGGMPGSPFGMGGPTPPFPGFTPTPPSAPAVSPTATVDLPASSVSVGDDSIKATQAPSTPAQPAQPADSDRSMDVVEPIVREPATSSSSSSSASASPSGTASKPKSASSFFASAGAPASAPTNAGAGAAAGSDAGANGQGSSVMSDMMEQMLRNPQMQQMLYPYLPEGMRNPQSIEWMLNNPEVKKQMTQMFEQQNMMNPQMMEMMKKMDFNQDKVNQQFKELGLKPEDVISQVMANPELAAGFSNPKVQSAIMDISANPMNISKYQSDPEVMKILDQVTALFQNQVKR